LTPARRWWYSGPIKAAGAAGEAAPKEVGTMSKWIKSVVMLVLALICVGALQVLLTPPASAAGSCWTVECNTCCRTPGGGVICTQRACV
jgi:hypothetical protein